MVKTLQPAGTAVLKNPLKMKQTITSTQVVSVRVVCYDYEQSLELVCSSVQHPVQD